MKPVVYLAMLMLAPSCAVKETAFTPISSEVGVETRNPVFIDSQEDDREVISFNDRKDNGIDPVGDTSAKCMEFIAKAELDSAILSAPTFTASIDELGEGQVSLSYDLVNIAAMELAEKFALSRCNVNELVGSAKALQKLTIRGLSRQGLMARAGYIENKSGRFHQIRNEVNAGVAAEEIKEKSRDRIFQSISKLLERKNDLKAKGLSQVSVDIDAMPAFFEVEQDLNLALTEQLELKKQADFSKNVRFILSGGYTFENSDIPTGGLEYESFGGASLSIKLGVLSPKWRQSKAMELQSALDQLYVGSRGTLSGVVDAHEKNKISIAAIQQKRRDLLAKINKNNTARRSTPVDKKVDQILLELAYYGLKSELIEIETNLRQLAKAQQKLGL